MSQAITLSMVNKHREVNKTGYVVDVPKLMEGDGNPLVQIEYENPITPTINGIAIWERLPWEDVEDYKKFLYFRELGVERTVFHTARHFELEPHELVSASKLYHWELRANSWDYYNMTVWEYKKKERQREIANEHYQASRELFNKCVEYCNKNLNVFKPKDVLQLMKLAADLGTSSVDLFTKNQVTKIQQGVAEQGAPIININTSAVAQNGSDSNSNGTQAVDANFEPVNNGAEAGSLDAERERIAGIMNVLHQIGALNPKEAVVEELGEDVIIKE